MTSRRHACRARAMTLPLASAVLRSTPAGAVGTDLGLCIANSSLAASAQAHGKCTRARRADEAATYRACRARSEGVGENLGRVSTRSHHARLHARMASVDKDDVVVGALRQVASAEDIVERDRGTLHRIDTWRSLREAHAGMHGRRGRMLQHGRSNALR